MPDTTTAYDWRAHALSRGIHPVTAWLHIRNHWPDDNPNIAYLMPLNTRRLDQLAQHPEHHTFIAACIDDIDTSS